MFTPLDITSLRGLAVERSPFVLLDTARPGHGHGRTFLFREPECTVVAERIDEVTGALAEVERLSRTHWLAGYVAYEAGYALEERLAAAVSEKSLAAEGPLLWFGAFRRPLIFDHRSGRWNHPPSLDGPALPPDSPAPAIRHTLSREHYGKAIAAIKRLIARGHTYQVNFTYDVELSHAGTPFELYALLRRAQATPYCSFIQTPYGHTASFSPELFFRRAGGMVTVKPMKGTAPRGRFSEEDEAMRAWLGADAKNRAENVMIVDLERNDLGRVCRPGSVETTRLMEIESHPTVMQMTSTVRGRLRGGVGLRALFEALYPCGSVTGAPKIRTMEIIGELEQGPRGVYCGAIGYAAPGGRAEFSVPIRTLQRSAKGSRWRYRVGSGVVWGSDPTQEWEECAAKCAFLVRRQPTFELLETILYRRGFRDLSQHLDRLRSSARYFGYPYSGRAQREVTAQIRAALPNDGSSHRVRILLDRSGGFRWESTPIDWGVVGSAAVVFSEHAVDEREPLLFHKTTYRPWYAAAAARIAAGECCDVLFVNSKGEITEGARSNLFARIDGTLVTPPVSCGLLGGVLRRRLLAAGACRERVIGPNDVRRAEELYCGNSVRGLMRVGLAE